MDSHKFGGRFTFVYMKGQMVAGALIWPNFLQEFVAQPIAINFIFFYFIFLSFGFSLEVALVHSTLHTTCRSVGFNELTCETFLHILYQSK